MGKSGEVKPDRGQWGNQIEFILACVGYAVGLGNVWRFPYLCFKNGGGAFLIPYTISLFVAGLPIFYLELSLGQFSSLGPNCLFAKLIPAMQGVGWGMVVCSMLVALYYNMIIAWVLYYFFASFRGTLLWSTCDSSWATEKCYSNLDTKKCIRDYGAGSLWFNKTCWNAANVTQYGINETLKNMNTTSPSEEYFERKVLNILDQETLLTDGFTGLGPVQWKLALALLGAWIIVFLCLIKGVQSTGKVVYFTATFPYVVLIILMIRGVTLEGAYKGIQFYMQPDLKKLGEITVWKDAAVQIFYSLGPAFGGLLTMASYNRFSNNCFRDACIVAFTNCGTSIFAGFAVFSIAGFMATDLDTEVDKVVKDGAGLAFIAYPEAIARMPVAPLWSILFFFMLVTLGLDSQFAMLETVTTALMDQFTSLRAYKTWVVAGACCFMYLMGLPLCTRGGMYVFTLLNDYSAGFCLIALALCEIVTVMHIYGLSRFLKDVEMMLGTRYGIYGLTFGPTGWYWRITWAIFTPIFLVVILIFSFVFYTPSKYGDYEFRGGFEVAGWIISCCSIIMVPIFMIYHIIRNQQRGEHWTKIWKPTVEWCPAEEREKKVAQAAAQAYQMNQPSSVQYPSAPISNPAPPYPSNPKY